MANQNTQNAPAQQAAQNAPAQQAAQNAPAQQAAQNAPAQQPQTKAKTEEARVAVYIPRGYAGEDPNLFVSVNGVNYLLPKGKTSLVPPHIKAHIDLALKAQEKADSNAAAMAAAAQK